MKILFVSDTVMPQLESAANLRRRYADVDLVVSCGDMPPVYLEYIISILNVPLFYVRGNHDEIYERQPPGGIDLHRRVMTYKGVTFAGLEGCIRYNNGKIQYTESEMNLMMMGMWPGLFFSRLQHKHRLDFLVTHSPVRNIHDAKDRPHQGMTALRRFLDWYRPNYMVHGHVHTYDRRKQTRTQYRETCIINVNPITVLEIDAGTPSACGG